MAARRHGCAIRQDAQWEQTTPVLSGRGSGLERLPGSSVVAYGGAIRTAREEHHGIALARVGLPDQPAWQFGEYAVVGVTGRREAGLDFLVRQTVERKNQGGVQAVLHKGSPSLPCNEYVKGLAGLPRVMGRTRSASMIVRKGVRREPR